MTTQVLDRSARSQLVRGFPQALILVVIGVIVFGFGHTFSRVVLRPQAPPPVILYIHIGLAALWLACLFVQSSLVVAGKTVLHRRLGIAFALVGAAMSVAAFLTAIDLRRLDTVGDPIENLAYLSIPLAAWILFTVPFSLAILWRRYPDRHRPLILITACALTAPALGRIPAIRHGGLYWSGLLPVMMMGAAMIYDRLRTGRWIAIYIAAMPLTLVVVGAAVYLELAHPPAWIAVVRWLLATF